jgi:GLPGLI family protein
MLLTAGQFALAQQKQADTPTPDAFYRGLLERTVVDRANIRILYALNAEDINKEDTYIDLGQLQIGKKCIKYCSLFAENADNTFEKWWKANPHSPVYQNFLGMKGREPTNWSEYQWSGLFFKGDTLTEWATMPFRIFQHYRYSEPIPKMFWSFSQETQTICGYKCQKATCHWRGRDFVAWFTTEIPIRRGPWKFGGLPGLILKVYDTDHFYTFEAIGIEKGDFPIYQYPKKLYTASTRQKVWKLQGDLNRNFRKTIGAVKLDTGELISTPMWYEQLEKE